MVGIEHARVVDTLAVTVRVEKPGETSVKVIESDPPLHPVNPRSSS
jgi:hypothetical protein